LFWRRYVGTSNSNTAITATSWWWSLVHSPMLGIQRPIGAGSAVSADITRPSIGVTSVKVVEKRVSEEVAKGQAAMGGSLAGSASISGGVISAIPSICM